MLFYTFFIQVKSGKQKHVENKNIKITRIATGIPMGTDNDYIDAMTLEFALEGVKDI